MSCFPVYAQSVPQEDTPDYKVAYYAFDCYNMKDDNGKLYGYGYDVMQNMSKYMQMPVMDGIEAVTAKTIIYVFLQ